MHDAEKASNRQPHEPMPPLRPAQVKGIGDPRVDAEANYRGAGQTTFLDDEVLEIPGAASTTEEVHSNRYGKIAEVAVNFCKGGGCLRYMSTGNTKISRTQFSVIRRRATCS